MVFTLVRNNYLTDFCYSTALYSPVLIPFYSEYNDYGAGENSSGIGLSLTIEALSKSLVEIEQGKNEYHDIPVKREGFDEDKYWEAIHEGRLNVLDYKGKEANVQFVMFHKRVVDYILENYVQDNYVGQGKGNHGYYNSYVQYTFADVLAELPPVIAALMENGKNDTRRLYPLSYLRGELQDNLAAMYIRGDGYRYSTLIRIDDLVQDLVERQAEDLLSELLIEYITGKFIDSYMMSIRKVWIPGCHEGSQSSEDNAYRMLIASMTKVLDDDKCRYDEDYDDTENEELDALH